MLKIKAEVKKVDNPITALNKNFTIDKNNASEVSSVNNPPFAIEQRVEMLSNKVDEYCVEWYGS